MHLLFFKTCFFLTFLVAVGASSADSSTAEGCFYSPGFPGRYPTTGASATYQYRVTLPTTAYVSFTVKMFDLFAQDSVRIRDTTAGSVMTMADLTAASSSPVIPFTFKLSTFSLIFNTVMQSPTNTDYGFVICYESLSK